VSGGGWKMVVMTSADISARKNEVLRDAFAVLYIAAGAPVDAGMYDDGNFAGPTVTFYFSPRAVALAGALLAQYGAIDCSPPANLPGLAVHVGRKGGRRRD
jgi:hypothetical protein